MIGSPSRNRRAYVNAKVLAPLQGLNGPGGILVEDGWILSGTMIRVPPTGRDRTLAMLEEDVRPFHLLHLLVDFQVEALRP